MWPSEAAASLAYDIANVALIVSLVAGVISTVLVVWMGNVKEEYLQRSLTNVTNKTAQANERAAIATNQAAQAQLALVKFREPRVLTSEQQMGLVETLRQYPRQEFSLSVAAGQEAAGFACLLDSVLKKAGWIRNDAAPFLNLSVNTDCGPIPINLASDVHIRVVPAAPREVAARAELLLNALNDAGIVVHSAKDPINIPNHRSIEIMVGAKQ